MAPWSDGDLLTPSNLNSKGSSNVFNVKDELYGATGDGSTDDRAAIVAAVAAAAAVNGTVFFPRGTYKITSAVSVSSASNVTLEGEGYGSAISASFSGAAISGTSCSRVSIRRLRFTGAMQQAIKLTTATDCIIEDNFVSGATVAASPAAAGILLVGSTGCKVRRNKLSGNGLTANNANAGLDILLDAVCVRCDVQDNDCTSAAATMHIGVQNSDWIKIAGNYCEGAVTALNNSEWGYGIMLYGNGGDFCDYCTVENNRVNDTGGTGIYLQSTRYSVVDANIVINTCQTQSGSLAEGGIALNSVSTDNLISNNQVRTSVKAGIRVDAERCTVVGNQINDTTLQGIRWGVAPHGCSFVSNIIYDCAAGIGGATGLSIEGLLIANNRIRTTSGSNSGIGVDTAIGLTVIGNEVREAGGTGIDISNSDRLLIQGNMSVDNDQGAGTGDGIRLTACTQAKVSGNQCYNEAGTTQTYGIRLAGACVAIDLLDNDVYNNATGGILTAGTAINRRGNRFTVSGAISGTATLAAGTVTISTIEVQASDTIEITRLVAAGTLGHLSRSTLVADTSFIILSSSNTETSTVRWEILH